MWDFVSCILRDFLMFRVGLSDIINRIKHISTESRSDASQGIQTRAVLEPVVFSDSLETIDILKQFKDEEGPTMVADVADIVRKLDKWKREMPRVEPFFAVKCNPHPTVLHILATLGVGFDCASKGEIETMLGLGVRPSRLIYAHTCKSPSHLRHARVTGVELMTFDNEGELLKVREHHPEARLVIRIRADESGCERSLGTKFGCGMDEVEQLLRVAKHLNLKVVGVSFHIGVNNANPTVFATTIGWCRKVFKMAEEAGHRMTLLDLGGGFPGAKVRASHFQEIARVVRGALHEHFPIESGVRIIAEPGKFFVESAFTLYTRIIGKRQRGDEKMYFINDGIYGSFRLVITHQLTYKPIPMLEHSDRPLMPLSSLWGPTCDSADLVVPSCRLPDMEVGHWIAFEDMGAYAYALSSTFNGFGRAGLRFVAPERLRNRFEKCCSWPELCELLKEHGSNNLN